MAKKLSSDIALAATTVALLGFGLVMVWSASSALAAERHGSAYHFVIRQSVWAVLGIAAMVTAMRFDYRRLRSPFVIHGSLILTSLLLLTALLMRPLNDTHRWIHLGPFSLQPAEMAKAVSVLFLAYLLEKRAGQIGEFLPTIFPAGLVVGWFAFLIVAQPDLGSALTLVLTACVLLFLGGLPLRWFAGLFLLGLPVVYQLVMAATYRRLRLSAFLNPWADPLGAGYQIIQSMIAIGTGGVSGVGLMEGKQKLFYLPYPYSDFIFAVIGEELGLIGALAVVAAFLVILWRGLRAAFHAPDAFGRFLAAGLTSAIVLQAFVNISVVLGLVPTKGIPLPFLSAGGSSLLFTLVSVGLILNISQHAD